MGKIRRLLQSAKHPEAVALFRAARLVCILNFINCISAFNLGGLFFVYYMHFLCTCAGCIEIQLMYCVGIRWGVDFQSGSFSKYGNDITDACGLVTCDLVVPLHHHVWTA